MFRKTLVAALSVAAVAGAMLAAPMEASARDGRNAAAVVGAIAGISGALIASSAGGYEHGFTSVGYRKHGYGHGHGFRGHGHRGERFAFGHGFQRKSCFEKPVTRWSHYAGKPVFVGFKTICR